MQEPLGRVQAPQQLALAPAPAPALALASGQAPGRPPGQPPGQVQAQAQALGQALQVPALQAQALQGSLPQQRPPPRGAQ